MRRLLAALALALLCSGASAQGTLNCVLPCTVQYTPPVTALLMSPPPSDATSLIQGKLNAGVAVVIPCDGNVWNVSGLTVPSSGASLSGECPAATLHITANAPAINCSGVSAPVTIRNLTFTGNAPNWDGSTVNISDAGQAAVHLYNCPNVKLITVAARNISGSAFDCEYPASGFNVASDLIFDTLSAWNSYRGFRARNSCEYATFTGIRARNNIFGAVIESGNVTIAGFLFDYNYNNIQIIGQSNANPCHATLASGKSNHAYYALDILSCTLGTSITGVDFVGDPGGALNAGGTMRIANSRGVNIVGGQFGTNLVVLQCDPATSVCTSAGANTLSGAYIRDDIAGFAVPTVNYTGGLLKKNNFNAAGSWLQNN